MVRGFSLFAFLIMIMMAAPSWSQDNSQYQVYFVDKEGVEFDPDSYFTPKAIQRRKKHGIPLDHVTDKPLKKEYVEKVGKTSDSTGFQSRWFNMVYAWMDQQKALKVEAFPFVKKVEKVRKVKSVISSIPGEEPPFDTLSKKWHRELLKNQTRDLGVKELRENGLTGKGIRVAVLDAGFPTVDKNPAFEHIRKDGRILKTHDFVQGDDDVYAHGSHGTMVLSCIAGKTRTGEAIGLAPDAEFLLARTERTLWEPFSEEKNWLAAAEWADKNGADIINSSLGYTYHRYFPEEMDGRTSLVSRAANMAAKKGILVVNAAGNDGGGDWKFVGTPADADSVLSIGGTSPWSGYHTNFSSFGPTADKELKPNLCAYGHVMASGPDGMTKTQGTSFSSPLVAGFSACALQSDTTLKVMELFDALQRSGELYPYFDYAHGYGKPRAEYFTGEEGLSKDTEPTFKVERNKDSILVIVKDEFIPQQNDTTDGKSKGFGGIGTNPDPLYYHIENEKGYLNEYFVVAVFSRKVLELDPSILNGGKKVRVHFKGYTQTIE